MIKNKQTPVIEINNFSKSFGDKVAVHEISFSVYHEDIFACIGANGSGKTTTIRALLGLHTPDTGTLTVFGKKYSVDNASRIGYLPEERGLYLDMPVLDTLVYFATLRGLSRTDAKQRAERYLEAVALADKARNKIRQLSSGQQQKIQLGVSLIHDPELLILDEPTKGLDPINRQLLMDIIIEKRDNGATILFSTHLLEEAEKIANRLVMIRNGRVIEYGTTKEIRHAHAEGLVWVHTDAKPELFTNAIAQKVVTHKDGLLLTLTSGCSIQDVYAYVVEHSIHAETIAHEIPTLEEIFIGHNTVKQ